VVRQFPTRMPTHAHTDTQSLTGRPSCSVPRALRCLTTKYWRREQQLQTLLVFYAKHAPTKSRADIESMLQNRRRAGTGTGAGAGAGTGVGAGGDSAWWARLCEALSQKYHLSDMSIATGILN
jgi:hypothetical protein